MIETTREIVRRLEHMADNAEQGRQLLALLPAQQEQARHVQQTPVASAMTRCRSD
jgi:hypothetical protein